MKIKDKNLYYVGGYVRDEILGLPSNDIDYCYEGNAINFVRFLNIIKENPDFGTVRIKTDDYEIDIASTRIEEYPKPGHLPVVNNIGCSLKDDLKRRDFTINALAKNTITGEIIDYFNGLEDLRNKKLRVLHDNSFIDDPSRVIRGLKFSIRFGFDLEENTLTLQKEYLDNINYDLSYHRLKKELKETFNLNSYEAFTRFVEQKIYKLLGDNQKVFKLNPKVETLVGKYMPKNVWLIYLGAFDLSKFELTKEEQEIVNSYNNLKNINFNTEIEIYNYFKGAPIESILIYACTVNYEVAILYLEKLSKIRVLISGSDLKVLGINQGKIYQEIFDYLLQKKIQNPNLTKEEELNIVKLKFIKN